MSYTGAKLERGRRVQGVHDVTKHADLLNEKYETSCSVYCAAVVLKNAESLSWFYFLSVYIFAALVPIVNEA